LLEKIDNLCLVIAFPLVLAIPLLMLCTGFGPKRASTEKRLMAQAPVLTWKREALSTYPADFEAFFNDHFGTRNVLIAMKQRLSVFVFRDSPEEKVVIGKDDWLFFSSSITVRPPSDEEFYNQRATKLSDRRAWLAEFQIPYLFVLAPQKPFVYPEYLVDYHQKVLVPSPAQTFTTAMEERGLDWVVNLEAVLLEQKAETLLFFRTDTHWNALGALLAYRHMAHQMAPLLEGFQPLLYEDLDLPLVQRNGGDLANMLGLLNEMKEHSYLLPTKYPFQFCITEAAPAYKEDALPAHQQPVSWICAGRPYKVLVLHDSFTTALKPYIAMNFGHTIFVWDRLNEEAFQRLVLREKPDLVIEERVSRVHSLTMMFGKP